MEKGKKKRLWKNYGIPLIIGMILIILDKLLNTRVLSGVWRLIKGIGEFLTSSISLPLWVAILLPVAGAGAVLGWQALARRRNRSAEDEYKTYTSDRILDVDWEWERLGKRWRNLIILCPERECSNELHLVDDPAGGASVPCMVKCEHCGFEKKFDMTGKEVVDTLYKEIPRRFRIKKRLGTKARLH